MAANEARCQATCWRGDPANTKMAEMAQCKRHKHSDPKHLDKNGNWFTGSGLQSQVCVVRGKKEAS